MSTSHFGFKKALQVFGCEPQSLASRGIAESSLPEFARSTSDNRVLKSWSYDELPEVGGMVGFMPRPAKPIAISVFVTKGGVLKSSLTLNFARMAALHGIRTCVVGLDMQGDVTAALSVDDVASDDEASFAEALGRLDELKGLPDIFNGQATLDEVICSTEIPTLHYIPETPELVALDQSLINRNRREYWLHDLVVKPLKERFDLILMDCSPNWNRLITNSLVASDVLLSPLECKINNFRNFKTFKALLDEFRAEMQVGFKQVFVPTRLAPTRRLSREIFDWYRANLPECAETAIRESTQGEESVALKISLPEHAPTSAPADEMRAMIEEVWKIALGDGYEVVRTPRISIQTTLDI